MRRALDGIKVIELAEGWSGAALCGRLLADLGAQVFKVESPDGDPLRSRPPLIEGEGYAFHLIAAGKQSVVLDLGSETGVSMLRLLARHADVLIDGHSADRLVRLGLGETALRRDNPKLIYCAVSTFGRSGSLSSWVGSDLLAQAMSGIMATTGFPDDPPTRAGSAVGEHASALFAGAAIAAALIHRAQTERGQSVDISAQDCLFTFHSSFLPKVFLEGEAPRRQGFRHPLMAPWDVFEARDGQVVICSGTNAHWNAILRLIGRDHLIDDPRYSTPDQRVSHADDVQALLQDWVGQRSVAEIVEELKGIGVPSGPILSLPETLADPHFRARNMLVELPHPKAGAVPTVGSLFKMSATPGRVERGAPGLGQDTRTVLEGLIGSTLGGAAG